MTRKFIRLPILCLLLACAHTQAADSIPLNPASLSRMKKGEKLEVEQIEIRRFGAIPPEIHRKTGRFLLLVVNHNETAPNAMFQVDLSSVGEGNIGSNPVLKIGGLHPGNQKRRSADLFDATEGEFDLKYADTGKIVCKIKID